MRDEEMFAPPEGGQQPFAVAEGPTDVSLKIVLLRSVFAAFGSAGPVPANALVKSAPATWLAVLGETEQALNERLEGMMDSKLKDWKAEFDSKSPTLTFGDPNLLFEQGSAKLRPTFEHLLTKLIPEYLEVL